MRRLALCGFAALCACPAAAEPTASQVVCVGRADGPAGEAVTVFIHVEPDGTHLPAYTSWAPPVAKTSGQGGLEGQPDLSLIVGYQDTVASNIGQLQSLSVGALAFSPLRSRITGAKLQARLDSLSAEAGLGSDAPVKLELRRDPMIEDLPGTAFRSASLALPESLPDAITLRLHDRAQKPVATMEYRLNRLASRDQLFAAAWRQADRAAANPATCEATATP